MRIFIAIDLISEIREKLDRFLDGISGFAPEARWVHAESLHVTLKFIGEQKPDQVDAIAQQLHSVSGIPFDIRFTGYGFFPTPRAPRVFWIGISSGPRLAELASRVDAAVSTLGVPREERAFSPHLTLARASGRSGSPKWRKGDAPNSTFSVLDKRLAAMSELDFGTMTAREFYLYQSQLSPKGSKYTKLQRFPLAEPPTEQ
jgi:2'-5' RNA ligase